MWDQRYAATDYVYGTEPNDFLRANIHHIPPGPVIDLGCGEGRNAVFIAQNNHDTTAVDQSPVGLEKAQRLAAEKGVLLTTVQADLSTFTITPNYYAGITSIFCHLPQAIRIPLYAAVVNGLKPGGIFLLEAYTPAQIGRGTGGPSDPDMLMTLDRLKEEIPGLDWILAEEKDREVREGTLHTGPASVVQFLARRIT